MPAFYYLRASNNYVYTWAIIGVADKYYIIETCYQKTGVATQYCIDRANLQEWADYMYNLLDIEEMEQHKAEKTTFCDNIEEDEELT